MLQKGFLGQSHGTLLGAFAVSGWIAYMAVIFGTVFSFIYWSKNALLVNGFFFLVIGYFAILHSTIYGHPRYHLPLVPILTIYGAHGLMNIKTFWNYKGVKLILVIFFFIFFISIWLREIIVHIYNLYLV
jgi:hypothetical protein